MGKMLSIAANLALNLIFYQYAMGIKCRNTVLTGLTSSVSGRNRVHGTFAWLGYKNAKKGVYGRG